MARPRTPILSQDRIVTAALELIDETGTLTLPLLARRLGVSMSSIYHHVANRAEIVEGIRELLSRDFPRPDPSLSWQDEVRRWMRAYRRIMVAHPHLIVEFSINPVTNETTLRAYEDLAEVLESAGFALETILEAITAPGQLRLRQRAGADRVGADVGLLRRPRPRSRPGPAGRTVGRPQPRSRLRTRPDRPDPRPGAPVSGAPVENTASHSRHRWYAKLRLGMTGWS